MDNLLRGYDNSIRPDFGGKSVDLDSQIMTTLISHRYLATHHEIEMKCIMQLEKNNHCFTQCVWIICTIWIEPLSNRLFVGRWPSALDINVHCMAVVEWGIPYVLPLDVAGWVNIRLRLSLSRNHISLPMRLSLSLSTNFHLLLPQQPFSFVFLISPLGANMNLKIRNLHYFKIGILKVALRPWTVAWRRRRMLARSLFQTELGSRLLHKVSQDGKKRPY